MKLKLLISALGGLALAALFVLGDWRDAPITGLALLVSAVILVCVLVVFLWRETGRQQRIADEADKTSKSSVESYRTLFDSLTDAVLVEDEDGQVVDANRAAIEMFSSSGESLWGIPASDLRVGEAQSGECTGRRTDGTEFPQEVRRAELDYFGMPAVLSVIRDITERKRVSDEMAYQASHDALTGLLNRKAFEGTIKTLLEDRRVRSRGHALLYIDLDQFKVVNDTCGHPAGDQLLCQLTALMHQSTRESDTLARLGGDEFGVLLMDCPSDRAVRMAESLITRINESRFHWEDKVFTVGASIGLVEITRDTDTSALLFSAADSACYAAKDLGRNRVVVYNAADEELAQRRGEMTLVSRITGAIQEHRFGLHKQRIEPAAGPSGTDHFELLLRMHEADGSIVPPDVFIPAAERYNVMPTLDRLAIRLAFEGLSRMPGRGTAGGMLVALNLSATTLSSEYFTKYVNELFEEFGLPPKMICFEITETTAISNLLRAGEFIKDMQSLGCSIALDDFGSGLSSFSYLKSLPVDYLKIDGGFIREITTDATDQAMVQAIVRVGQTMGILTIAEFVDTEPAREMLREMGVDFVQGYAVHRPEPWTVQG